MVAPIYDTLTLPDAPDVPGLVFRRFHGESDYPGLATAGTAGREADGSEWVVSVEDVAREFAHLVNSDPSRDMIIAEMDSEIAGFTRGEWWREDSGLYLYWFALHTAPLHRGQGIRRAMLHWIEARLREVAADHPADAPKQFTTHVAEKAQSLLALLESEGYRPVRFFNKMVRSLDEALPDFPMPAGLEMRPVLPEHYRLIWEADNEAFRDHWGHGPAQESYYQEWLEDPVIFRPELWQIAWDVERNEIAGQVRTFINEPANEARDRRRGYTEFISVRRPYRKRGLARALIAESLRVLKAQGMTESALTVDSESLTGATRLYETCGFRAVSWTAAYRKPLALVRK
jgi:GNAT superfamily N-acetyltransferase